MKNLLLLKNQEKILDDLRLLRKEVVEAYHIPDHVLFGYPKNQNIFYKINNFIYRIKTFIRIKIFWFSVKPLKECLFSRRNGHNGKIIKGYSIRLRIFGKDLI